jgi:AhpD family alkylhydroperoxidase
MDWWARFARQTRPDKRNKTELTMSRLPPIQINGKNLALKQSLKIGPLKLAKAPRFLQVMANSPAAFRAYILADAALLRGELTRRQRQQVALAVAEINGSTYSLSALDAAGKRHGLTHNEMQSACNGSGFPSLAARHGIAARWHSTPKHPLPKTEGQVTKTAPE